MLPSAEVCRATEKGGSFRDFGNVGECQEIQENMKAGMEKASSSVKQEACL